MTIPRTHRPLLHRYPQQSAPQPAYLTLSAEGVTLTDWDAVSDGAPSNAVWHRRTLRWRLGDPSLTTAEINDLLDAAAPLVARVHAGHTVVWDGKNHVGQLTDDASAASDAMATLCDDANSTVEWDAARDGALSDYWGCWG
jgi:hypothetical protein